MSRIVDTICEISSDRSPSPFTCFDMRCTAERMLCMSCTVSCTATRPRSVACNTCFGGFRRGACRFGDLTHLRGELLDGAERLGRLVRLVFGGSGHLTGAVAERAG